VLLAHASSTPHVQAGETPLPVLDEHATRKGWMWVFATSDALLFVHSPSRGQGVPDAVFGNTKGGLTVDGYTASSGASRSSTFYSPSSDTTSIPRPGWPTCCSRSTSRAYRADLLPGNWKVGRVTSYQPYFKTT